MPKRKSGEPSSAFIDRCMGDDGMNKEFPDNKQRYAECQSKLRQEKKDTPKHERTESKKERRMEGE